MSGEMELARGELAFYRDNTDAAVPDVALALKKARNCKQVCLIHRALYLTLRIAAFQGNFGLAEQIIKETKDQLNESEYLYRFLDYDISLSWYYCYLGLPENAADWVKDDFSAYAHAGYIENFGNQIKARYCYATRNYPPLLIYIEEMKKRESFLFGRIEMLVIEAFIHYKTKDKRKAFAVLEEAYKTALPNEILLPFIELGKDMRTLSAALLKEGGGTIPKAWLEDVYRKSSLYARRRAHVVAEYMRAYGITGSIVMTPREKEILSDLSHGLSRADIVAGRGLSINTVKMVVNNIYTKLGAENLADLIRIAVEQKLI
jgi:LuxR family maltose regulon positive regulatory protein